MKILVDADACPVKKLIEEIARLRNIPVIMVSNISHYIKSDYSELVMVDGHSQSADIAIINRCQAGDIIVTQDYGLASLALSRGAFAIHPSGNVYSGNNMDTLLMQRYLNDKIRRAGGRINGPKKRNPDDDRAFKKALEKIIKTATDPNS